MVRLLLLAAISFAAPAFGRPESVICDLLIGEFAPFDGRTVDNSQGDPSSDFRGVRLVEGRRTYPALLDVMAAWRTRGVEIPSLFSPPGQRWNGDWTTLVPRDGLPRYGSVERPVELTRVDPHHDTHVMTVDGRRFYVRDPVREHGRYRFVAADMNAAMELGTVPRSRFAIVNGELKLVSDEAPGQAATRGGNAGRTLVLEVGAGRLKRESLYETWGFEFLVGQTDGTSANYRVTPDGGLSVFDHNLAFFVTLPAYDRTRLGTSLIGRSVPPRYTPRFLRALRALTPEIVRERWGRFLGENELRSILFRRDLMLTDAARRRDAALIIPE